MDKTYSGLFLIQLCEIDKYFIDPLQEITLLQQLQ